MIQASRIFVFRPGPFFFLIAALFLCTAFPRTIGAGEQAERAVQGVKELVARGAVPRDAVVKILVKQGNINNYWGREFELKNEWEQRTGILIDANVMPQVPLLTFIGRDKRLDLTIARQREYPDLFTRGLIMDLTPFMEKYGMRLDGNGPSAYLAPLAQSEFAGRTVAVPADGDVAVLYLRKDLLEDPANRARFRERFGGELSPPETWEEYIRLVSFFHRPEEGFYGSCEERDLNTGWMFWMLRYACRAYPNQYLFDDNMRPLIDSPEGILATEQYIATIPYSPPHVLKEGNNYSYTLPIFNRGKGFSFILTMSAAKLLNSGASFLKERFILCPIPGARPDGRLVKRPSFIYGNNMVVPSGSKHPELAFLYAMWLTDPDISARSVMVTGGMADPFRYNHLTDERMAEIYTGQALSVLSGQIGDTIPAGTGLPGDSEYIEALNRNIWLAGNGALSSAVAMENTAREWEAITERLGRERQIRYWRSFKKKFPKGAAGASPPEKADR